ncbi:minor capsid protein [Paenibacillus sabinae]|uniref:Minor capsid protein n=1 Tax=Paenibacillus sabinae T27 TaxID=1268072 RepID=X5A5A2_9BACL|nr:minor capsid protein [Paenibacillus sabinae]AHV98984.1 hypothetical protein PSAB_20465 [Paenibacillus sabinae T27]
MAATITIADTNALLRVLVPGFTFVGLEFATGNPDDCAYTRINGGDAPSEWTPKSYPSIQIVLRAKLAATAETKANAIYAALHGKTEFTIGTQRVVKCVAEQSAPWYLGKDDSARSMYSLNFTLTTI